MTIYVGTIVDTPGDPFDGDPADALGLAVNLRHARDTTDALARIFSLATPADVAGVWTRGVARHEPSPGPSSPGCQVALPPSAGSAG
jgi:hypothetical protein